MEENKDQQKLYGFMQMTVYFLVVADCLVYLYQNEPEFGLFSNILKNFKNTVIFENVYFTKSLTLILICLVGIGTKAKKNLNINAQNQILIPLVIGLILLFIPVIILKLFLKNDGAEDILPYTNIYQLTYILFSFIGAITTLTAIDNISKIVKSNFGKDKWNIEGESFEQELTKVETETSLNIPTLFYYNRKINNGWINIDPFRGTMVIGTPGSGKSFGIINPAIRQMLDKQFTMCLYDFKFPDLGKIAYYHYLLGKQKGKLKGFKFQVINLNDVEKSARINPLNSKYVKTLAQASEMAEAIVEALKKGDRGGGADQFFSQSAINFLASSIYFLAKYQNGKYSTLPHLLSFLSKGYDEIFTVLYTNKELEELLSPFYTSWKNKATDQLEGQIGTLKIFISRLSTKESAWVFGADDFDLKISDPKNPCILVLASDPETMNINSALYSLVLNRLLRLINSDGNLPTAIIADEVPTLYIHRIENVIATARSKKVAILLGLQELPQFRQQYGKETADTIQSVIGNVLSGSVRNKDTLEWLEKLFGKIKQKNEALNINQSKTSINLNEKNDVLIPSGKIASLKTGEMVGIIAKNATNDFDIENYKSSAINCKINLNLKSIKVEENNYRELPNFYNFNGNKEEILYKNFVRIKEEVNQFIEKIIYDKE